MQCKTVISRFQRKIDKEGHEIVPLLTDLWKRIENSVYLSGAANSLLDLRKIGQRVERFKYNGVMELVFDVQFMLKSAMQYFGFSQQVWLFMLSFTSLLKVIVASPSEFYEGCEWIDIGEECFLMNFLRCLFAENN